jgi:hypothetical protein
MVKYFNHETINDFSFARANGLDFFVGVCG